MKLEDKEYGDFLTVENLKKQIRIRKVIYTFYNSYIIVIE